MMSPPKCWETEKTARARRVRDPLALALLAKIELVFGRRPTRAAAQLRTPENSSQNIVHAELSKNQLPGLDALESGQGAA